MKNVIAFLVGVLMFLVLSESHAQSKETNQSSEIVYIKMYVDGLACPFCAYGLEKKVKKIKGAKDLFIEINEGYITFSVPYSNKPDEEALEKLVKEAGFKAREIIYAETPFSNEDDK